MADVSSWLQPLGTFPPYPGDELASWTGPNFIVSRGYWGTYVWLVVMGAFAAFAMAWAIGANDVANSFATSVGAKTLTLWQACLIAAVFEFTGAMVLGGEVARTIAGSITSPTYFVQTPEVFAFGMMCALFAAAFIVTTATYFSYAVSTTHSIIGAVLGFGLVFGGADSIVWNRTIPDFPYRTGVVTVFMSWFIAPISAAILAGVIFFLNRLIILRRKNSTTWALWSLPILALITVFINVFFVLYKGAGKVLTGQVGALYWDKAGGTAAWVSAVAAAGAALLCVPGVFLLRKRIAKKELDMANAAVDAETAGDKAKELEAGRTDTSGSDEGEPPKGGNVLTRGFKSVANQLKYSLTVDVHEDVHKNADTAALHANAEVFPPMTEEVYKYLQVFSACCVAFAHGANDVANAIGPFAGIWYVYTTWNVSSSAPTPIWMFALGGGGLVIGLGTYGYNIIKVLGVQMAKMTPSRGFAAELGTSLIIALASVYGLPVSTTQCIVGAEVGVGLVEGGRALNGVNWKLFAKTFLGWVAAFVSSAFFSAALFSWSVFAPGVNDLDYVNNYNAGFSGAMTAQLNVLNSTNLYRQRSASPLYSPALNTTITGYRTNLTSLRNVNKFGKINQYDMLNLFQNVTGLYLVETIPFYNVTTAPVTP